MRGAFCVQSCGLGPQSGIRCLGTLRGMRLLLRFKFPNLMLTAQFKQPNEHSDPPPVSLTQLSNGSRKGEGNLQPGIHKLKPATGPSFAAMLVSLMTWSYSGSFRTYTGKPETLHPKSAKLHQAMLAAELWHVLVSLMQVSSCADQFSDLMALFPKHFNPKLLTPKL